MQIIDDRRDAVGLPPVSLRDAPGLGLGIIQPPRSRRRPGSGTALLVVAALAIAALIVGMTVGASTIQ